jgi:uncharacterized protein YdhG (YjbR/CyaY superfamily)
MLFSERCPIAILVHQSARVRYVAVAKKPAKKAAPGAHKSLTAKSNAALFTDEEKAAIRDYVKERQAARAGKEDQESDVLAKIAKMPEADRTLALRLHGIIKATAPALSPRLWYGMPAYAKDGKVVCFFQDARKFKTRYATLGFSDKANLDEGRMWPNSYALSELTPTEEARIVALVKKAVS